MIIAVILDESGSMNKIKYSTIDGYNEFIEERKDDLELTGKQLNKFVFIKFNSNVKYEIFHKIDDITPLNDTNYSPSNMTSLYDAIGKSFELIGDVKDEEIHIIIITDGLENRSTEYSKDQIQKLIVKYKQYDNWNFIFCGANQDSYLTTKAFGLDNRDTIINFETQNEAMPTLFRSISSQVRKSTIPQRSKTENNLPINADNKKLPAINTFQSENTGDEKLSQLKRPTLTRIDSSFRSHLS